MANTIKIEPEDILVNFLRANLTDINSSRSGNWIYGDFPLVTNLGDNQFPRVAAMKIDESSDYLGMYDNNQRDTIPFQIDVIAKKDQLYTITETDEAVGTIANSPRITLDNIPKTVTNIKHDGTSFGTVTLKNTDDLFTAPGSLAAGTVEVSLSTGNLNFSSADLTSYSGESITSTYVYILAGDTACSHIAREIVSKIRTLWRTDSRMEGLFYPQKISNRHIPFDENIGIFRRTIEYTFNGYNVGEGT